VCVHSNESDCCFFFYYVHHLCYDECNYIFELIHFNVLSVHVSVYTRVPKKFMHILTDVIYVLFFEVELNYSSSVQCVVGHSLKRGR
jgi:hypothetical protein